MHAVPNVVVVHLVGKPGSAQHVPAAHRDRRHAHRRVLVLDVKRGTPPSPVLPREDPVLVPEAHDQDVPIDRQRVVEQLVVPGEVQPLVEREPAVVGCAFVDDDIAEDGGVHEAAVVHDERAHRARVERDEADVLPRLDGVGGAVVRVQLDDELAVGRRGDEVAVDGDGVPEAGLEAVDVGVWWRLRQDLARRRPTPPPRPRSKR